MGKEKLHTPNPFIGRNADEVWAELMSKPAKAADKNAILAKLIAKIKSQQQPK